MHIGDKHAVGFALYFVVYAVCQGSRNDSYHAASGKLPVNILFGILSHPTTAKRRSFGIMLLERNFSVVGVKESQVFYITVKAVSCTVIYNRSRNHLVSKNSKL